MFDKSAVKEVGKKFQYGHDKTGRMIKVTMVDGEEVKREFLNARIVWPGGTSTQDANGNSNGQGVANLGIHKFKRDNPNATGADIAAYKDGAWAYPPAQMMIDATAMVDKKGKKK